MHQRLFRRVYATTTECAVPHRLFRRVYTPGASSDAIPSSHQHLALHTTFLALTHFRSFLSKEGGGACPDEAAAAPECEGGGEEDAPEDGDAHEAFGPSGVADEEGDRSGGMCESRGGEAGAGTRRNGEPEVGGTEGTEPEGGTQGGREGRPPANGGCSSTAVAGEEGMFSDVTLNFMTGMSVMRNLFASLSDIPEDSGSSSSDLFPSLSLPTTCIDSSPLALPSPVSVTSPLFLPTTYVAPPSASPAAPSAASSTSWSSRVRQLVRKFSVSGGAGLLDNAGRFLNRGGGGGGSSEENEDEAMDHQPGWVRKRVSEIERIMRERALEREYLEDEKTRKDSFKNLRSDDEEGIGVRKESFCQEEEGARKDTVLLEMEKEVFADPEDFPESGHEKLRRGEGSEIVVMEYAREEREGDGGKENELETRGGPREGQGAGYANGGREDHKEGESEAGETEREDSEETLSEDGSEEDTNDEDDDGEPQVELRGQSRSRPASLYRYSSVRPRTIIMGLGVCTETQFFSEDFGEGVSETESEDEEEFVTPTGGVGGVAEGSTNTHQAQTSAHAQRSSSSRSGSRPPSPSAGKAQARSQSRPHSPLSDMDTESKRNSQAVSTEPSEIDDHSSVRSSDLESCHDLSSPRSSLLAQDTTSVHELDHTVDARKDKAYRIAHELLNTERTYVKVLHLIDQEFQFRVDQENRAHHLFPADIIPQMFSNVKSIYKLHHDFLLPQLEERMAQWEQNRRIGDIMKSFAPFLKMYTEYVRNFDNAMTIINSWQAKCPRFAAIMDEIHSMEVCGNLTLQHHMLSPVQRIPRYEMLLREYLKKLPEDSPDRHDTEKALHLVSTAANHANDAMKKIDKFEKLLEIQESLGGAVDLVSPTRELVKEGKIIKISARSGDHQERYVFLLTDLLLLCSPRLMGSRVMSGPQYRLRARYNVENLQVHEGDNLETANTFYIRDNNKSVELYTQTIEEKEQWLEALFRAIHETYQRKSSLKLHCNPDQRVVDLDLGQKQPTLIRSDSVTKCMECGSQFTMVRRKHHCRACGAVVCSKCSSFKASLAYDSGKNVRVSAAADGAVAQGFLQLKTHRKAWVKRWFALHTDFVLYSFKCDMDDQALTATPVPGFTVTHLQGTRNESGINDKEKERAFKLHHSKKQYIFLAASKEDSLRWVAALKKASQAELPSPVQ
ncbi:FYVE, RhoGEF and PH domain-containing protein 4 [Penaeus vannamei]|uniref:FYVE, RhoGEF and PH domain-containing protein 4 n=1 Tax=Penaeus vannamei TaxID=6689 RepID=A0A423TX75_PENVA|nr:FYVE, RhoGEF and PH domain-containing protein 4 [Penaeus vannamei]